MFDAGFYDALWLCNLAIAFSALGCFTLKATLISTGVNLVTLAHFFWIVDVIAYLLFGFFPFGSAEYLSWPQTTTQEIISSLHHVWYVPLGLFLLRGNGGLRLKAIWYSILTSGIMAVICWLFTPKTLLLANGKEYYLNVNSGHEFWRDMKYSWMHWGNNKPKIIYFIYLNWLGLLFNTPFQVAIWYVSQLIEPPKTSELLSSSTTKKEN